MARVGAYIRVSTDGQVEDGYGLDIQRAAVIEWCKERGHEAPDIYSDEGISGSKGPEARPGLARWIADAAAGVFDIVLVPRLDRLSRDLFTQLWVEKELLKHGKVVHSIADPNGNDPMTTAFRQMMGVFAELERNTIKMRLAAGREQKASRGGYAGGRVPLGFRASEGTLKPEGEAIRRVKRVFELYESSGSFKATAEALNAEGVQTARGGKWHPATVSYIIQNPKYRGEQRYKGETVAADWDGIL